MKQFRSTPIYIYTHMQRRPHVDIHMTSTHVCLRLCLPHEGVCVRCYSFEKSVSLHKAVWKNCPSGSNYVEVVLGNQHLCSIRQISRLVVRGYIE